MTAPAQIGVQPALAELPELEQKRAAAEWPFRVGLIPLRVMFADDTYQRPVAHEFVSRIVPHFDPTLVGAIDVSERKNGSYAILDGQQRFWVMMQIGKTACFAAVYTEMSIPDEAAFFYRKNRDRKSMSAYYAFRARVVAGDETAKEIMRIVEHEGFALGAVVNEREVIGAIRAVETAYGFESEYRVECLTPTLQTIRGAFFGRKGSLDRELIQGIARFWQAYSDDEVDRGRLHSELGAIGPQLLVGRAKDSMFGQAISGSKGFSLPWAVSRQIVSIYNKSLGAARAGRLDQKRLS